MNKPLLGLFSFTSHMTYHSFSSKFPLLNDFKKLLSWKHRQFSKYWIWADTIIERPRKLNLHNGFFQNKHQISLQNTLLIRAIRQEPDIPFAPRVGLRWTRFDQEWGSSFWLKRWAPLGKIGQIAPNLWRITYSSSNVLMTVTITIIVAVNT